MREAGAARAIRAVVSDVDGTLVTDDKVLTPRARAAALALKAHGYLFSIISARPPRALQTLAAALEIDCAMGAFNGGALIGPDFSVLERNIVPPAIARRTIDLLMTRKVQPWVFAGDEWLALDASGPAVAREFKAVQFAPHVVANFDAALAETAMIVAVHEDVDLIARCEHELLAEIDGATIARSHPNHLDITAASANKGDAIAKMAKEMGVPLAAVASLGDGDNDTAMFARTGLSIAMGNAAAAVKAKATATTATCNDEGFAKAVDAHFLT